jgi:hypothetical protein
VLRGVPGPRPITASLGIAVRPEHGATGAELLAAADQALYAAKSGGRDQARIAGREGPVSGGDVDDVVAALPQPRAPEVGALPG